MLVRWWRLRLGRRSASVYDAGWKAGAPKAPARPEGRMERRGFKGEVSCAHLRADLEVGAAVNPLASLPAGKPAHQECRPGGRRSRAPGLVEVADEAEVEV